MSTPIEPGAACPCGQSLPWHLLELGVGLKHICSCERTVVPTADGGFEIPDERTPNPVARAERDGSLDRAVQELLKNTSRPR